MLNQCARCLNEGKDKNDFPCHFKKLMENCNCNFYDENLSLKQGVKK